MNHLSLENWTERARAHQKLVSPMADAFLQRRALGQKHPVYDFLFTYYTFSPAKLKLWVPSFEESLWIEGLEDLSCFGEYWFKRDGRSLFLNPERLQGQALALVGFIEKLCCAVSERSPRFGCFGLHEWAMVYHLSQNEIRHAGYRLRLSSEEIALFVESQQLCCTHYDAYRFFTSDAKPLNVFQPTLQDRMLYEQAGCLHANMDLYKWATKLWPWVGSDLIAKTFLLALEGRELDMRASPYDLRQEGYDPICIETEAGRKQYQGLQQKYTERAKELRQELAAFCSRFISSQKNVCIPSRLSSI